MPTYEYECTRCGRRFEVFQSIKEPPLIRCRYCRGKVKKLISGGGGIIFKGSGFYATDYKKTAHKDKGDKDRPLSCPAKETTCHDCPMNGRP